MRSPDRTRDKVGICDQRRGVVNRDAVIAAVAEIMRGRTTSEWMTLLEEAGIPAGPINTVEQALQDPHVLAREMTVSSIIRRPVRSA